MVHNVIIHKHIYVVQSNTILFYVHYYVHILPLLVHVAKSILIDDFDLALKYYVKSFSVFDSSPEKNEKRGKIFSDQLICIYIKYIHTCIYVYMYVQYTYILMYVVCIYICM